MEPQIFKAYDIRGIYPKEINEKDVYKIAQAYAKVVKPKTVALGRDIRESSDSLWESAKDGLVKAGVKVIDIGKVSTDMLYFATANYKYDGGITITASHNPREYNGLKLVGKDSIPIFKDYLMPEIQELAMQDFSIEEEGGEVEKQEIWEDYVKKIRSFGNLENMKPLKIVINGNFGLGGIAFKKILGNAPVELVELNCEPDGTFPKGRPDPLVPENRQEIIDKIKETKADIGFAWDADADRFFAYDENGQDVEGFFVCALLAKIILEKAEKENEKIVYEPRVIWPSTETIRENGGFPVISVVGHTFIKEKMREVNAIAGVEGSGHFYFRDFFFCDNGMIPAVLILSYLNEKNMKLSEVLKPLMEKYFVSGEINFEADNKDEIIDALKKKYAEGKQDELDGLSVEFGDWRFNVRKSNTEPLLRLNMEARKSKLLDDKKREVSEVIESLRKE